MMVRADIKRRLWAAAAGMLLAVTAAWAQDDRKIDLGFRASFTSTLYTIEQLTIDDTDIEDVTTKSEVSLSYAGIARYNVGNHYYQTELAFSISRYSILFPTAQWSPVATAADISTISTELIGVEVPLFYGYYLQRQGPYRLSIYGGPKVNFIIPSLSRHLFENFTQTHIDETIWPFIFSGVVGLNANISHLFFDLDFEFGLNNISRHFTTTDDEGNTSNDELIFNRRKNGLTFSIGFFF